MQISTVEQWVVGSDTRASLFCLRVRFATGDTIRLRAPCADVSDEFAHVRGVLPEVWLREESERSTTRSITYVEHEKVLLFSDAHLSTLVWTRTRVGGEVLVEREQKPLLSALGTAPHPLSLSHQGNSRLAVAQEYILWRLLNLDNFFFAILREEDTSVWIDIRRLASRRRSITKIRVILRILSNHTIVVRHPECTQ